MLREAGGPGGLGTESSQHRDHLSRVARRSRRSTTGHRRVRPDRTGLRREHDLERRAHCRERTAGTADVHRIAAGAVLADDRQRGGCGRADGSRHRCTGPSGLLNWALLGRGFAVSSSRGAVVDHSLFRPAHRKDFFVTVDRHDLAAAVPVDTGTAALARRPAASAAAELAAATALCSPQSRTPA